MSAAEMAEIDRRAIREFGIPSLELMENAGRIVAEETLSYIKERLKRNISEANVLVCCGRGNNGGDGLVAVRHLKEKGSPASFVIIPPKPHGYGMEVTENLRRAREAGAREHSWEGGSLDRYLAEADVLIDAVLGTGSSGEPSGEVQKLIQLMTSASRPIVAVDIPSGLDPNTGAPAKTCVLAALTLTLGLPKRGLVAERAKLYVGELKVVDIGFPKELLG